MADLLAGLSQEQLTRQSLCDAWTVREVGAHLVTYLRFGQLKIYLCMLAYAGNFAPGNERLARMYARRSTEDLIGCLRRYATAKTTVPRSGYDPVLADIVLHDLDVRIPLGIGRVIPEDRLAVTFHHLGSMPSPGFAVGGRLERTAIRGCRHRMDVRPRPAGTRQRRSDSPGDGRTHYRLAAAGRGRRGCTQRTDEPGVADTRGQAADEDGHDCPAPVPAPGTPPRSAPAAVVTARQMSAQRLPPPRRSAPAVRCGRLAARIAWIGRCALAKGARDASARLRDARSQRLSQRIGMITKTFFMTKDQPWELV